MYHAGHYELDRHVRLEVQDFYEHQDPDALQDWIHSVEAFFTWYDIPENKRLQFAEAKLKDTTCIWWENYKEEYRRLDILRN